MSGVHHDNPKLVDFNNPRREFLEDVSKHEHPTDAHFPSPDVIKKQIEEFEKQHPETSKKLKLALSVIDKAHHDFGENGLALAYNGGKDCSALTHLIMMYYQLNHQKKDLSFLYTIYFHLPNSFEEITEFAHVSALYYGLKLEVTDKDFKEGLAELKEKKPEKHGVLMGTRRSDPRAETLDHFTRTDGGWPDFVRINPVLEWDYQQVWNFIRSFKVPYCPLYDRGFTSIGLKDDTVRNDHLKDGDKYVPAHLLRDPLSERAGRKKKEHGHHAHQNKNAMVPDIALGQKDYKPQAHNSDSQLRADKIANQFLTHHEKHPHHNKKHHKKNNQHNNKLRSAL